MPKSPKATGRPYWRGTLFFDVGNGTARAARSARRVCASARARPKSLCSAPVGRSSWSAARTSRARPRTAVRNDTSTVQKKSHCGGGFSRLVCVAFSSTAGAQDLAQNEKSLCHRRFVLAHSSGLPAVTNARTTGTTDLNCDLNHQTKNPPQWTALPKWVWKVVYLQRWR